MRWGRKTQNEIRQVGLGHNHMGRARLDTIRSLVFIHHVDPRWDCKQRCNITQRPCGLEQQGESKARGRETHQKAPRHHPGRRPGGSDCDGRNAEVASDSGFMSSVDPQFPSL